MRKALIVLAVLALPTAAVAQHRGGWHGGGGFHNNGGHWHNGAWVPWAVGAGVIGGAIVADSCWRVVIDQWGYQRRVWVC